MKTTKPQRWCLWYIKTHDEPLKDWTMADVMTMREGVKEYFQASVVPPEYEQAIRVIENMVFMHNYKTKPKWRG